jgi:NAD(P)-dependent dehydrogenase (short-subunit alcohol dehydrogenase family)
MAQGLDPRGAKVVVTGASSGIGAALAERLAAEGATVGLVGRDRDRLGAVLERCRAHGPESRMWPTDLADFGAVDVLAATAIAEFGGVDVLVNNAGIPKRKPVTEIDPETVELVDRVNYLSPVRLTLRMLPHMLERGSGRIVMVSSVAATLSSPGEGVYDASKAALSVFSEAMAVDLWDTGVRVNIVYPGVVDTPLFSVPDNDPLPDEVEKITVEQFVDEMMAALREDRLQAYIPAWFEEVAARKASDVGAFLAGTAAWVRQRSAAG